MSKSVQCIVSIILILVTVFVPVGLLPTEVTASAASEEELNRPNVFLKQQTTVTCTLASAAMLMRRTAICANMEEWEEITEENIRPVAWTNGVGLRWNFTFSNITIGHGYFSGSGNKTELLNLLEQYPQGLVIYNAGNEDQTHAVFLCDYDELNDIFYVSDPAINAPEGRIPLLESTIKGETQDDKINNLDAYWYIVSPVVTKENGEYIAPDISYDPPEIPSDTESFNQTKEDINAYFVVSDETTEGAALRYYPSGNSASYTHVNKGTILYVDAVGKNNFGAKWYKTSAGYYIFSTNLVPFEEYSEEIVKFNNTVVDAAGTYSVRSRNGSEVSLRLEPAEGNNIVSKVADDTRLYITASGVNSIGAKWYKTQEGYYVKASDVEFVSEEKLDGSDFNGELSYVTGEYRTEPVEDENQAIETDPVEYKVTASALNVRTYPVDGVIIGKLPNGTVVEVTAFLGNWGKIEYNSQEGWISLEYAEKITNVVTPITIESIKISNDLLQTGNSVVCSVNINSDVDCFYKYYVYDDKKTEIYVSDAFVSDNSFLYKAEHAGVYYFYVEVRTDDGRYVDGYSGNFTVRNKLQLESVKSNADDCIFVNEKLIWTVTALSVSPTAKYRYALYCNGEILLEKDSISPIFSHTPEFEGEYVLRVYLEDEFSSSEELESDKITVISELNIESIDISKTTVVAGDEIVCTLTATGGVGGYRYLFSVFKDDVLFIRGAYTSKNNIAFRFTEAGTYKVFCTVVDSENAIISSFSAPVTVLELNPGDIDNDGKITAIDARKVLRYSAGLETMSDGQLIAADVNGDGKANAIDARLILRCAANLENLSDI